MRGSSGAVEHTVKVKSVGVAERQAVRVRERNRAVFQEVSLSNWEDGTDITLHEKYETYKLGDIKN